MGLYKGVKYLILEFEHSKFDVKTLCVTIAGADIRGLKSLHTFLYKQLYHMLVKFEQKHMVRTTRNI